MSQAEDPGKKNFVPYSEEKLQKMSRAEASSGLNERKCRWCEVYVRSFNPEIAALKAGYARSQVTAVSRRLRGNPDVKRYLAWLKLRAIDTIDVRPIDILEQYIKIGFADVTDYAEVINGNLKLIDSDKIDGQVVKRYTVNKSGAGIELYNKLDALQHLERFFSEMPKTWQQRLEERRIELQEERIAIEREALGQATEQQADQGSALVQALKGVAADVWNTKPKKKSKPKKD